MFKSRSDTTGIGVLQVRSEISLLKTRVTESVVTRVLSEPEFEPNRSRMVRALRKTRTIGMTMRTTTMRTTSTGRTSRSGRTKDEQEVEVAVEDVSVSVDTE